MASIKMFAGTDVGLRDNNEDNFIVCPDLTKDEWMVPANQQEPIQLGLRGCLVVVADGMGGMNAGEVASDIAVKTVKQMFAPSVLPTETTEKPESIKAYLKKVITQADQEVKKWCKSDPSTEGMGSTIVIAWLLGNRVYVGWLGDSRAYLFSPTKGIERLSKDHSFVQQLVDAKMLTEVEAMNHPESNVVVRSLGDTSQKAKPDVIVHPVSEGDIILLCSDGLCGVCTDEEISNILKQGSENLQTCKETLTTAALDAGGSDNITVALLQVFSVEKGNTLQADTNKKNKLWLTLFLSFVCLICLIWALLGKSEDPKPVAIDSIVLKLSTETMTCQDTVAYDVAINPKEAYQAYRLECKNKNVSIDTVSRKIYLKKDVQGETQVVAIAIGDTAKKDAAQLKLRKQIVVADTPSTSNSISIDFRINHRGPLEHGKKYGYNVSISPETTAKNEYTITCSSTAVTIDKKNQIVMISEDLTNDVNCEFTLTVNNLSRKFKYKLKGSGITEPTASPGNFDGPIE